MAHVEVLQDKEHVSVTEGRNFPSWVGHIMKSENLDVYIVILSA